MIQRRKALGNKAASDEICNVIRNLAEFKEAKSIMIYMPILNEVDITGLIDDRRAFLTPITEGDEMYAAYVEKEGKTGQWGIWEPIKKKAFDKERIELVIAPGVAFDKKCNRLGFGKGYYDRFLVGVNAFKIGVCYGFQMAEEIECDENDIKMDMIVTEDGVWRKKNTL